MDAARYQRLFVDESRRHLDAAHTLLQQSATINSGEMWSDALLRHVHTIKGMAAAMQLDPVVGLAHQLESQVAPVCQQREPVSAAFVRTMTDGLGTLDKLITASIRRSNDAQRQGGEGRTPLLELTGEYVALVRSWGKDLHKDVTLGLWGQDVEIQRPTLDALHAPLVQLLRNAVDHGIEPTDVRRQRGKPARGSVLLRAFQAPPGLRICVSDDGAGLDPERIAQRAKAQGLVDEEALVHLDTAGVFALLSLPGFSLAAEVTTFSGRGVGLDVVKADLQQLGGVLEVASTLGRGSHFCCYLPDLGAA